MAEDKESIERRKLDKSRFRVDTTVTITHIFTTLGALYAIITWGGDIKIAQAVQGSAVQSIKAEHDRERAETLQALRDINKKLDNLMLSKGR